MKEAWGILLLGATVAVLTALASSETIMTGGQTNLDVNSKEVKKWLGKIMETMAKTNKDENNDTRERELDQIISATKQIVEGELFRFTVKLKIKPDNQYERCDITAWDRHWMKDEASREMYTAECHLI